MIHVLKHTLHEHGIESSMFPAGAVVLCIGQQQGAVQIWWQCDTAENVAFVPRKFAVIYTGMDEVPPNSRYIGTAISEGGNIVRHVFEILADD